MFQKYFLSTILLVSLSFIFSPQKGLAQSKVLTTGQKAPLFSAKASLAGHEIDYSLKRALAKGSVVLYFYPAAYTGGCDIEAHTFAEFKKKFSAANTTIIGVSADDIQRLNSFSADPDYCAGKFPVASDPGGKVAATYGLKMIPPQPGLKDKRGKLVTHGFLPRTTFVINSKGKIVAVFSSTTDNLKPDEHVKKALAIVKNM